MTGSTRVRYVFIDVLPLVVGLNGFAYANTVSERRGVAGERTIGRAGYCLQLREVLAGADVSVGVLGIHGRVHRSDSDAGRYDFTSSNT